MRQPKIGECIYALAFGNDLVGETQFLTSTQENATRNLKAIREEVDDIIKETCCEPIEDDPEEYKKEMEKIKKEYAEELGEVIIYAMVRIA